MHSNQGCGSYGMGKIHVVAVFSVEIGFIGVFMLQLEKMFEFIKKTGGCIPSLGRYTM